MAPGSHPSIPPILLYDGVCCFCNRVVQWILRVDKKRRIRLAPLQGPTGALILHRHILTRPDPLRSVVFVEQPGTSEEKVHLRSDAVIHVLGKLGGVWLPMKWLFQRVPRPLRDSVYDAIGRRRYRWFGRYEECPLPPPEERDRFLP